MIEQILSSYPDKLFKPVTKIAYIEAVNTAKNMASTLNISSATLARINKRLFPNKPKYSGKLRNYILSLVNSKYCTNCKNTLDKEDFYLNKSSYDGLNSHCKNCHSKNTADTQAYRQALYNSAKSERTPKFACLNKIKEIYSKCPKGYHVDHIIPLRGEFVSGLHIETNLQYLLPVDNIAKSNKF